jgi:hypothetical protein
VKHKSISIYSCDILANAPWTTQCNFTTRSTTTNATTTATTTADAAATGNYKIEKEQNLIFVCFSILLFEL